MVIGDFNEMWHMDDKKVGRPLSYSRLSRAHQWTDALNLLDLGFQGQPYTWSNRREGEELVSERLDRVLCNPEWRILFEEATLYHLETQGSDHCPILLMIKPQDDAARKPKPFRFENMWMSHADFFGLLQDSWNTEAFK